MAHKEKIPSGCDTVDKLLFGGFPTRKVSGISAPTTSGKSVLGLQFCLQANKMGAPAVIVETEGMDYDYGKEFLAKRFGVKEPMIYVEEARDIKDVLALFGLNLKKYEVSEGGRLELALEIMPTFRIGTLLESLKPKVLLLDSFSQFIKNYVEQKTSNLPARATLEEMFFGRLQVLAEKYDLAVILAHQAAGIDPMHSNAFRDPFSSDIVYYNTKYLLEIIPPTSVLQTQFGAFGDVRRVRRARYDMHKPSDWELTAIKEDVGFVDVRKQK
ncbi:MAG: hypothetical protein HY376_02080 [Candidatus Blackburnbacteria bacterium]|nr:hypothetical protein [Candidatus Blackburnbacteria bacterium]